MQVNEIGAVSRVSFKQITKSGDVFYTFEYNEKWSVDPNENKEELQKKLWETVNNQVTQQVIETKNLYKQQ